MVLPAAAAVVSHRLLLHQPAGSWTSVPAASHRTPRRDWMRTPLERGASSLARLSRRERRGGAHKHATHTSESGESRISPPFESAHTTRSIETGSIQHAGWGDAV